MENRNRPKYMKIIEAAVIVIAENGFHQAQVSKIARQAGVADGTIYLYFKNKEDILISLFEEKMGSFIEKIEHAIRELVPVEEKLKALIDLHFRQLSQDFDLAVVTQLELRQSNKMIRTQINHILKGYLDLIDSIVDDGRTKGVFKADIDTRLARQMIFGTLDETVSNWVMNDHKYDLVALANPVCDLLLNGLKN